MFQQANLVGLKFLLEGSTFFITIMPEDEAQALIRKWMARSLGTMISDKEDKWALKTDSIKCMHLEYPQAQQQNIPWQPGQVGYKGLGSGLT